MVYDVHYEGILINWILGNCFVITTNINVRLLRTLANGMTTLYILILGNTCFFSWSFVLIKNQIVQNFPTIHLSQSILLLIYIS